MLQLSGNRGTFETFLIDGEQAGGIELANKFKN